MGLSTNVGSNGSSRKADFCVGPNELFRYPFSLRYAGITLTDTNRRFICMPGAGELPGERLDNIPWKIGGGWGSGQEESR